MPKPQDLVLCADCEEIYPREAPACPSCTGRQAIPLSRLTGEEKAEELVTGKRGPKLLKKTA